MTPKQIVLRAVAIALFAIPLTASAQPAPTSASAPSSRSTSQAAPSVTMDPKTEEVAALRAQLSTMQNYHESLLSTVYWSLGSILAALILFVGYGWYSNKRINDKEIELLINRLRKEIDDWKVATDTAISETLDAHAGQITQKVSEEATKSAADLLSQIKRLRSTQKQLQEEFTLHQAEMEVRHWEAKNVPSNVFSSLMEVLRAIKDDSNYDWKIDRTLEHMTNLLRADNRVADAPEKSDCVELISSLPPRHEITVKALRRALSA